MQLWTIQPLAVWQIIERTGMFRTDPLQSFYYSNCPNCRPAYDWITRQLERQVGPSPDGCQLPVWAWFQWSGTAHPKPDLRYWRHGMGEDDFVRIEIEISRNQVLLSDFHRWFSCISYWYVYNSEAEADAFNEELEAQGLDTYRTKPLPDPIYHARIEQSWERVFDLEWTGFDGSDRLEDKCIQAVFWELRREQVRAVTHFRGTSRARKWL